MIGLVLVTHGQLAAEFRNALEHVVGPQEHFATVAIGADDDMEKRRKEIADAQGPDLTRVLERLPGVTLSRNGGIGGFTGLRVRGADAEQVLVLVDGVRVVDVASPGDGFDFGNLLSRGPVFGNFQCFFKVKNGTFILVKVIVYDAFMDVETKFLVRVGILLEQSF